MTITFALSKERMTESTFVIWHDVEEALVGQLVAAAVILGLMLHFCFYKSGV